MLEPITKAVPGLLEGLYLLAKVKFLSGQAEPAQSILQRCLDQNPQFADAHLLMAQVCILILGDILFVHFFIGGFVSTSQGEILIRANRTSTK